MNTNIEVLRELDELVEAARLLGATQAKKGFGCHTDEDRRFERAMYESIDKHRAALVRMVEGRYHPCTHILIDGLKRLEGGAAVLAEWDRATYAERAERLADAVPAQQPAAEQDCDNCGGFGDVSGEYPGDACPDCRGTGKVPAQQPAAVGEHDLSAPHPAPEDTMNKYTPIRTHAQLVGALRRGLTVEINSKSNESAADYQAPRPSSGWIVGPSVATIAAGDPNSSAWQRFAFRAVGEHDLNPAKAEPPAKPEPLTNADFNQGDIVRLKGKLWRVQGIDDNARADDLLLLALTEPVDSPDFMHAFYPVTRGSNRRPKDGGGHRWRWARAEHVELVSRGEPEARVGGEVVCAVCEEMVEKIEAGYVPRGHGVYSKPFTEPEAQGWRPIETVPNTSEVVLFCDKRGNRWTQCADNWDAPECGLPASYWMPLPAAPGPGEGE